MMKKKLLCAAFVALAIPVAVAQVSFTDATNSLNSTTLTGGVAMAITDMNDDGLDDVIRLDNGSSLEIEFQQTDGTFQRLIVGNVDNPWGLAIADVDENGYNDIVLGGSYDGLKVVTANGDGTSYTVTNLGGPNIFLQNANFADIDNDGSVDFFGCHDDGISSPYRNDGSGGLSYDLALINAESTVPSDNSGNYGSIWTDYDNDGDLDLYIAKCRQGVNDPADGRRLNLMFQNDGNNNFTEVAEAIGLRPMRQSWASNFEDIDNDGDFDVVIVNHEENHQIFENNGDGTFTNITASSGIENELLNVGFGIQVVMEDFDNDGFIDILMTALRGNGDHRLFLNNGDKTFSTLSNPFNTGGITIQSAACGDLNNDGFIDFIAGFAQGFNGPSPDPDMVFMNDTNANNWSKVILEGDESNVNGIGARVEFYGAWGMQTREVRSGESYGTQNSLTSHVGIGTATAIDRIVIEWPSGTVDEILNPNINETIRVTEGETLSVGDINLENSFRLYPNPSSDLITITPQFSSEFVELNIYDLAGKTILTQQVQGTGSQQLAISQLTPGIYFVQVGTITQKLIKQ